MVVEIGLKKKVEQMVDEWAATDSPHAMFLGLLKIVPGLCELDQIVHMLYA